jgi:hypothetical protein
MSACVPSGLASAHSRPPSCSPIPYSVPGCDGLYARGLLSHAPGGEHDLAHAFPRGLVRLDDAPARGRGRPLHRRRGEAPAGAHAAPLLAEVSQTQRTAWLGAQLSLHMGAAAEGENKPGPVPCLHGVFAAAHPLEETQGSLQDPSHTPTEDGAEVQRPRCYILKFPARSPLCDAVVLATSYVAVGASARAAVSSRPSS